MFRIVVLGFLATLSAGNSLATPADPIVQTPKGRVRGFRDGVQNGYFNIPFGAPPVGPLRWRPTQPAQPWSGLLDGTKPGKRCPQWSGKPRWHWGRQGKKFQDGKTFADGDEDCLNLNVYTPADAKAGDRLPVMVYLFPGGDEYGDNRASMPAIVKQGIVLVIPNYRIGVFGFMAHPQLTTEGGGRTSPNYGLYDQTEALRWVRDNISSFGGDPNNVTLFGGSAGAQNAMLQVANPFSQGLFHRAIVASAYPARRKLHDQELWGDGIARRLGCGSEGSDVLDCLRRQNFADLADAWYRVCDPTPLPNCSFEPVVDGITFVDSVPDYLETHASVPLLLNNNSQEFDVFLLYGWEMPVDATVQDFADIYYQENYQPWYPTPPQQNLLDTLSFYPVPGQVAPVPQNPTAGSAFFAFSDYMGDHTWVCNENLIAQNAASFAPPAAVYRSYLTFQGVFDWLPRPGATHMLQEAFFLEQLADSGIPSTPENLRLAEEMNAYWTNFAKYGNPNGPGLPEWPVYTPDSKQYLELNTPIAVRDHLKERECAMLDPLRTLHYYYPIPPEVFGPLPPQNPCGMNFLTGIVTHCPLDGIQLSSP
jgi:para-nitrobenzyl esterase